MENLKPSENEVNLLQQAVSKLEDIKVLLERVYVQGVSEKSEWPWIESEELSKLLGLHERTQAVWRENGTLSFSKVGKKIYYHKREIEQLLWSKFQRKVQI